MSRDETKLDVDRLLLKLGDGMGAGSLCHPVHLCVPFSLSTVNVNIRAQLSLKCSHLRRMPKKG